MVRKKGSLLDRAAAFALLLQDSPVHNLDCLDTLIHWVSPKGKRECFIAMGEFGCNEFTHPPLTTSNKSGRRRKRLRTANEENRSPFFLSTDALVDLFLHYLLPPSRKLVAFENRPLENLDVTKRADQTKCLVWYFEGQLKKMYMRFIENVEKLSYDKVEASKSKAVKMFFT